MGDHSRYLYPRFYEEPPGSLNFKRRKLYELLETARNSFSSRAKLKFGEYIEKEKDYTLLADIFARLDASLIPPSPFDITDEHSVEQVEHALAAVHNLSVVFDSAGRLKTEASTIYYSRCFDMLLERWSDVVRWMVYVIVNAPAAANDDNIIVVFAHTLNQILRHTSTPNPRKEELRSIPYTSNLICVLLCWTSPGRGYYFASQSSSDACIIISLLDGFARSEDGCYHFKTQLKSLGSRARRKVLESLVHRPEFWLRDPFTNARLQATLVTLELLVRGLKSILPDKAIMADCVRLDIVPKYSNAFYLFCDRLISSRAVGGRSRISSWRSYFAALISFFHDIVLNRAKDRRKAFKDMKCQLVVCALQCILHVDDEVPNKNTALGFILTDTINYLTYSDVYRALLPDYPGALVAEVRGRDISKEVYLMCLRWEQRFVLASEAFDKRQDIPINMCNNLKHSTMSATASEVERGPMACSRCHTAIYCSEACQEDDWNAFHSKECKPLSTIYQERKSTHDWISISVRQDHLAYIEYLANNLTTGAPKSSWPFTNPPDFPIPDDSPIRPYHPTSTIMLLDTTQYNILSACPRHPLRHHHHIFWRVINSQALEPRIQAFVKEAEERPDEVILVEGIFVYDGETSIFVLAKMSYDPERPTRERYKVMNSLWRMGNENTTALIANV
ncbi:hypothetical protein MD484_g5805, partial [Candolleomyces efflorescens]